MAIAVFNHPLKFGPLRRFGRKRTVDICTDYDYITPFRKSGTSKTEKVYHYYKCATAKRTKKCDKKTVGKVWLENIIIKAIKEKVMDDDAVLEALADSAFELQQNESTALPKLKAELCEVESGINNLVNAIQKGVLFESTKQRLADLEEQKKQLEITILQEQIKKPFLTREEILFGFYRFRKIDLSTKEGRQKLIDAFVNAIFLYNDYAIVTFNYRDGSKKITFSDLESSDILHVGSPTKFSLGKSPIVAIFSFCVGSNKP
jgi:hypothetical protein